jgi:hypothetical protein
MPSLIDRTLLVIAGFTGFILVYLALLLYEDEEGFVQNKLENLWVFLDSSRIGYLSRHARFATRVARLVTLSLDRIFGERVFSLRAIWTSAFLAYASTLISGALIFLFEPDADAVILDRVLAAFMLFVGSGIAAIGVLPMIAGNQSWLKWGCFVPVALWIAVGVNLIFVGSTLWDEPRGNVFVFWAGLSIELALSTVSCILLFGCLRWGIKKCATFQSVPRIVLSFVVMVLVGLALTLGPVRVSDTIDSFGYHKRVLNLEDFDAFDAAQIALMGMSIGNGLATLPLLVFAFSCAFSAHT